MRYKPDIDPNHIYVAKRLADLADYANPLTFSLIQKLYAPNGPVRSELKKFGLSDPSYPQNHITNIYGRIYSDINIENKAIWYPAGYMVKVEGDEAKITLKLINPFFPQDLVGFFKKIYTDVKLQLNLNGVNHLVTSRYTQFLEISQESISNHHLTLRQFMNLYRDIIYIEFIHKTLKDIYDPHDRLAKNEAAVAFLTTHDCSIHTKTLHYEHAFKNIGFNLGYHQNINPKSTKFIEGTIPMPNELSTPLALTVKTQAMLNNMHMRIPPMLYELNTQLREIANMHNIEDFGFLTLEELFDLGDEADVYRFIISERKQYYDAGQRVHLPDVIRDGILKTLDLPVTELTHFRGIGCSPGKVIGILGEINNPKETVVSDINIFPNASPDFTPHFKKSRGIIFQSGSPLAHGAIIARELNIPAIILDTDFSPLIGKQVAIDGSAGTITVVD